MAHCVPCVGGIPHHGVAWYGIMVWYHDGVVSWYVVSWYGIMMVWYHGMWYGNF